MFLQQILSKFSMLLQYFFIIFSMLLQYFYRKGSIFFRNLQIIPLFCSFYTRMPYFCFKLFFSKLLKIF